MKIVRAKFFVQILVYGRKVGAGEMVERIDEVTPESLRRVAIRVFGPESGNKATVVCMGKEDAGDWPAVLKKYGVAGG
jgi:mitochondrial-processing peptidase subunit alpha